MSELPKLGEMVFYYHDSSIAYPAIITHIEEPKKGRNQNFSVNLTVFTRLAILFLEYVPFSVNPKPLSWSRTSSINSPRKRWTKGKNTNGKKTNK